MGSRFGAQPRKVSKRRHQGGGEWTSRTLTKGRAGGSSAARVAGGGGGKGRDRCEGRGGGVSGGGVGGGGWGIGSVSRDSGHLDSAGCL